MPHTPEGLEALIFTSEGDMRQAINNLQSTHAGFGMVNEDNVFKICDQPHPKLIHRLIGHCAAGQVDEAMVLLHEVWRLGYSTLDILSTLFKVTKSYDDMPEYLKLEFIKVSGHL